MWSISILLQVQNSTSLKLQNVSLIIQRQRPLIKWFLYPRSFCAVVGIHIPKIPCLAFSNRLCKVKECVKLRRTLLTLLLWSPCVCIHSCTSTIPFRCAAALELKYNKMQNTEMLKRLLKKMMWQLGLHRVVPCLTTWIRFNLAPPAVIII